MVKPGKRHRRLFPRVLLPLLGALRRSRALAVGDTAIELHL